MDCVQSPGNERRWPKDRFFFSTIHPIYLLCKHVLNVRYCSMYRKFGFPCGWAGKESVCNAGDLGSIPGLGRSLGEGNGYPLQNSGLENSMDCIVRGVAKSQTQQWLSLSLVYYISEKAMATHSSTVVWEIPWTEEPGKLQSMGSRRVRHNWATSLSLFTFMHWRRKWQPTPVFLPGESQRQGSLVGCRLWGHTESDMTEVT